MTRIPDVPLARVPRDVDLPLSFAQQRLWVLDQLELAGTAYNLSVAVRLRGALSVAALSAALDGLLERGESVRTSFPVVAGQPIQRIDAPRRLRAQQRIDAPSGSRAPHRLDAPSRLRAAQTSGVPHRSTPSNLSSRSLPLVGLCGLPEPRRQPEMERLTAALARRPFALAEGPLLRA